jgi:hypothetical protein
MIHAGSRSGLSDLAIVGTGTAATTFTANSVGNGTYYVRVLATNAIGSSGPSNEVAFTIGPVLTIPPPGPPPPPAAPLTGTWTGNWSWLGQGPNGCSFNDGGAFSMTLTQTGNVVSGSINASGVQTRRNSDCTLTAVDPATGTLSGTYSAGILNLVFDLFGSQGTLHFVGSASLGPNTLSGSFRRDTGGIGIFNVLKRAN